MEKGKIKVSVLYPNGEGKTFNTDYYFESHLPLVSRLLGDSVIGATVEKGLGGGEPGSSAPFHLLANLYFDSMESFQNAFGPNVPEIMGDLPNFTNIEPVVQVSEVLV